MAAEDWMKENSKWIVPVLSAGVGIWIFFDGVVLSQEIPKIAAGGAVAVVWYIFNGLRKDFQVIEKEMKELENNYNIIQRRNTTPQHPEQFKQQDYVSPPMKKESVFDRKYG